MANRPKLKKKDISINEVLELSKYVYRKNIDDKLYRMRLDILGGKIRMRKGLTYNRSTKEWEQTSREVRIDLVVRSQPKSYKDTSGIKLHKYPITFIIRDWEKGLDSAFRSRVGSLKKPKFGKKGKKGSHKKAQQYNIQSGIQMQFFFDSMKVWKLFGLLFGPDYTNGLPKKRNPDLIPFFSKHELFIVLKILPRLFADPKTKTFKKTDKPKENETADKPPEVKTEPKIKPEEETIEVPESQDLDSLADELLW